MTKEEKKTIRLARAKRTALGRFLCRLFGDNAGQAMMEYVVIAVLIVAAAVGVVMIFGDNLKYQIQIAYYSMIGDTKTADEIRKKRDANTKSREGTEGTLRTGITGHGEEGGGEQSSGGQAQSGD